MKTTTATVRIRLDQAIEIEKREMNLSDFVRQKLDEEFGSNDFIREKEKELIEQLQKIKQLKKEAEITKDDLSIAEKNFIYETKKLIERDPLFLEGRWRAYKNDFMKTIPLSKFKELLQ